MFDDASPSSSPSSPSSNYIFVTEMLWKRSRRRVVLGPADKEANDSPEKAT